jgi:hypothetical protein
MAEARTIGRRVTWVVLAVVWLAFTGWYTSCGGPLSDQEIDQYIGRMQEGGAPPERLAMLRAFLEADTGDDFVMVNVIDLKSDPGSVSGLPDDATADEILAGYMAYMWPALLSRACHPVFFGSAAAPSMEQFGMEGVEVWTRSAMMRYRSRRDLMEIVTNPAFEGAHEYKVAAIEKTFAFPADPWAQLGDPRLVLLMALSLVGLLLERLRIV